MDNVVNNMKTMRILLLSMLCSAVMIGCADETPEYVAQRLTMRDLNTAAGYVWFPMEVKTYAPNAEMVDIIRQNFGTDRKVVIYVRPTCSCTGTQRLFPQVVKTLTEAGVDSTLIEIYSVRGTTDRHPYQDRITLSKLPAFYQFRNDVITTFIDEANYSGSNADTLIAEAIGR